MFVFGAVIIVCALGLVALKAKAQVDAA
jgi:hypothetical protein